MKLKKTNELLEVIHNREKYSAGQLKYTLLKVTDLKYEGKIHFIFNNKSICLSEFTYVLKSNFLKIRRREILDNQIYAEIIQVLLSVPSDPEFPTLGQLFYKPYKYSKYLY